MLDRIFGSDFFSWAAVELTQAFPGVLVSTLIKDPVNQERLLENVVQMERFTQLTQASLLPSRRREGVTNDACNNARLELPLNDLRVPTLIIHGTADNSVPYATAADFATANPDAELYSIEGGDHYISYTHPEEYHSALNEFLRRHLP